MGAVNNQQDMVCPDYFIVNSMVWSHDINNTYNVLICVQGIPTISKLEKELKCLGDPLLTSSQCSPPLLNYTLYSNNKTDKQKTFETQAIMFYLKTNTYIEVTC